MGTMHGQKGRAVMIDTNVWWAFFLLWLVIVPTPGANSLMVTHTALSRPAAHVAFAVAGNVAGILLLASAALLGWGALIETLPVLRVAVHVLGGAYLIYFGHRLLQRSLWQPPAAAAVDTATVVAQTEPLKALALGFVTALSNAQAILFITSIFAVSGVLTANAPTGLAVLATIAACNLGYLGLLGWMFQRERVRRSYQRFRRWFEGGIGVLFAAFGARLIWRELTRP
jgi:threonine efflux protein